MLTTSVIYDNASRATSQKPIYIIELAWNSGHPGTENLNDVYFSTADTSKMGVVPAWLSSRLFPLLDHTTISALTEHVDEMNGTSSIGTMRFSLIDRNGVVTEIFKRAEADTGQSLRRQRVELYIMYEGMDWVDRIKWRSMNIYDAVFNPDKAVYDITAQSILRWMKKDLFIPVTTTLQSVITNTQAAPFTITVADTTNLVAAIKHSSFSTGFVGAVKINDEIFLWDTKTATSLHIVARALFGSQQSAHAVNDSVTEVAVLKGNPYELLLRVLHSSGTGANGVYDVYPAHWGLGLTALDVDDTAFINTGVALTGYDTAAANTLETGTEFELVFSSKIQAKVLVERELLRNTGAFDRILGDGRVSCKPFDYTAQVGLDPVTQRINSNGYILLDEDAVVKWSPPRANMQRMSAIVDLQYNLVPRDTGKPLRRLVFENATAQIRHGTEAAISITHRGMQSDTASVNAAATLFNAMQSRFVAPPVEIKLELLPSYHVLEVGDIVAVDLLKMRDVFYTTRKWAAATKMNNGTRILTAAGQTYVCSVANATGGTTGATEPVWGATSVTDNTVTWVLHDGHMSRLFEVKAQSINLRTGRPTVSLISQAEEPAWWSPAIVASSRYNDSAYMVGTDLATLGWTGGTSPAGAVTLGALDTTTDYFFVGDITFAGNTTLTILGDVRIWCTGTIIDQVGFSLTGLGNGYAGGVGHAPNVVVTTSNWLGSTLHTAGTSGGFSSGGYGGSMAYSGVPLSMGKAGGWARNSTVLLSGAAPDAAGLFTKIIGVPQFIGGAGGGAGGATSYLISSGIGANGARGGAGLALIARNINIINGTYDLRGGNAPATVYPGGLVGVGGGGGGGGGTVILAVESGTLGGGAANYNPSKILLAGGAYSASQGWYVLAQGAANNGAAGRLFARSF